VTFRPRLFGCEYKLYLLSSLDRLGLEEQSSQNDLAGSVVPGSASAWRTAKEPRTSDLHGADA